MIAALIIALYIRVSTQEQSLEGYSIAAQINVLRSYATTYNYGIYKIYQDQGISGKNIDDRPALLELIEDAKQKKFDVVLVWKLSRLSRSLLDLLSIVDIFTQHNISFQSYSEKFDTSTPIGKMLLHMLGSIAEFERNTIIENVKLGMGERFKQGYSKGAVPFGYRNEDKKTVLDAKQADMVKFAFNYYINSFDANCLQIIANYFNQKEFVTRVGGKWNRHSIKELLMNKFYAGYARTGVKSHGRKKDNYTEVLGVHESIISIEEYKKVLAKLDNNKNHPHIKNPDNDNILTGLIICPLCGQKLYSLNTTSPYKAINGTVKQYVIKSYRCINGSKGKLYCQGFNISARKIEPKVLEIVSDICYNKSIIKKIKSNANKTEKETNKPIFDKVKLIENDLKDLYSIRDRYYKLFETGKVDIELFADKINEVLKSIDSLEKQKTIEISKKIEITSDYDVEIFIESLKQSYEMFNNMTNYQQKQWLRSWIKEIILNKDKSLYGIKLLSGIEILYHK